MFASVTANGTTITWGNSTHKLADRSILVCPDIVEGIYGLFLDRMPVIHVERVYGRIILIAAFKDQKYTLCYDEAQVVPTIETLENS